MLRFAYFKRHIKAKKVFSNLLIINCKILILRFWHFKKKKAFLRAKK
jgi:hypothetical protein